MKDKDDKLLMICQRDCPCHEGARYDQIECKCDWFCGEDYSKELANELREKQERFVVG